MPFITTRKNISLNGGDLSEELVQHEVGLVIMKCEYPKSFL
jgi:hypothetical protein